MQKKYENMILASNETDNSDNKPRMVHMCMHRPEEKNVELQRIPTSIVIAKICLIKCESIWSGLQKLSPNVNSAGNAFLKNEINNYCCLTWHGYTTSSALHITVWN